MILAVITILVWSLVGPSISIPLDWRSPFQFTGDNFDGVDGNFDGYYPEDNYGRPCSRDNNYRGQGLGVGIGLGFEIGLGSGGAEVGWPFGRYGSTLESDTIDLLNPTTLGADISNRYPNNYYYPGHPSSVNFAKENYVRGNVYGTKEYGIRNEATVRNGFRSPYPKLNPFSYLCKILRNCGYPLPAPCNPVPIDCGSPVFPFGVAGTRITSDLGFPEEAYPYRRR